jgi:hypothetical protein
MKWFDEYVAWWARYERTTTSGFFIEKTFERMCREFLAGSSLFEPHLLNIGAYSTPRTDVPPEQMTKQYRGLQRGPLQTWVELLHGSGVVEPTDQELAACLFMTELEKAGKVSDDITLALEDAREVLKKIDPPVEREIIWARRMDADDKAPPGTVLLGYEVQHLLSTHLWLPDSRRDVLHRARNLR